MKSRIEEEPINLGFQIAPMIDVVFVIMLFFMIEVGHLKVERQLNMALPGRTVDPPQFAQPVEEIVLVVDEDGLVSLNEDEVGAADDSKLESLTSLLIQIHKNADGTGLKVLATLQTDEATPYQRVMDVMNALARAKISNLTFTVGEDRN